MSNHVNRNAQKTVADSSGEVVKYAQEGMPQLEVWLEDETIWLTQKQMGELFGCAPQNITYHIKSIYKIGELDQKATCKDFLQVQIEGGRRITRNQKFYNIDEVGEAHDRRRALHRLDHLHAHAAASGKPAEDRI